MLSGGLNEHSKMKTLMKLKMPLLLVHDLPMAQTKKRPTDVQQNQCLEKEKKQSTH